METSVIVPKKMMFEMESFFFFFYSEKLQYLIYRICKRVVGQF